jgi:hypothetical protein
MDDDELNSQLVQGTPIFEYTLARGGRQPIALKPYFESITKDPLIIAEKPRSVFFLHISPVEAEEMQKATGIIVQSGKAIEDKILKGSFFKDLTKNAIFEDHATKGWTNLVNFPRPPSNAMVITDHYLFTNEEHGRNIGHPNLVTLIDAFLPASLSVQYHITVIANDSNRTEQWCHQLTGRLKAEIIRLRNYDIVFEMVLTNTMHKRKIILNYLNGGCDKGFAVFKPLDGKTVISDNDFRCDRLFQRVEQTEGDTDFVSAENALKSLKKLCKEVGEYVNNAGARENYRVLGDCNADKTLKNRLINDV